MLSTKRSLALSEFALGMEGLERFVQHEPLRRVRECECVFGVLALESEPMDPVVLEFPRKRVGWRSRIRLGHNKRGAGR